MQAPGPPPTDMLEALGGHLRLTVLLAVLVGAPATLGGCLLGTYTSQAGSGTVGTEIGCAALVVGLAGIAVLWGAHLIGRDRVGDPRRVIRGLSGVSIGGMVIAMPGLFGLVALLKSGVSPFDDPLRGTLLVALLVGPLGAAMHAAWATQKLAVGVHAWETGRSTAAHADDDPPPPPAPRP